MNPFQNEDFLGEILIDEPVVNKELRAKKIVQFVAKKAASQRLGANNKSEKIKRGGYRPVLVDQTSLSHEAIQLAADMQSLRAFYSNKSISDQDLTVLYMLFYLNHRYPTQFLENLNPILTDQAIPNTKLVQTSKNYKELIQFSNKNFETKLSKFTSLFEIVNNFNLHSVPHSARYTLVNW